MRGWFLSPLAKQEEIFTPFPPPTFCPEGAKEEIYPSKEEAPAPEPTPKNRENFSKFSLNLEKINFSKNREKMTPSRPNFMKLIHKK